MARGVPRLHRPPGGRCVRHPNRRGARKVTVSAQTPRQFWKEPRVCATVRRVGQDKSLRGNGCGPGFEAANFESKPERGPLAGPLFMSGWKSARQLCICHICPRSCHPKTKGALGVRSPTAAPHRAPAHRWAGPRGGSTPRGRTRIGRSSDRACRRARTAHRRGSGPWRCPASRHGF